MKMIKRKMLKAYIVGLSGLIAIQCSNCHSDEIYNDSVLKDSTQWMVEQMPGGKVFFTEEGLEILDSTGCTVWFKNKLEGALMIEYKLSVIDKGGPYDRVSDMNVFWMASDPKQPDNLFYKAAGRNGRFRQYDKLKLYYVGCGGHNNTRTRFRRYNGTSNRPLEKGHDLSAQEVLLKANHTYTVQLIADNGKVKYIRDGRTIFSVDDPTPLKKGWFGFRVYKSHQLITGFRVIEMIKS